MLLSGCGGSDGPPRASETQLDLGKIERDIQQIQRRDIEYPVGRATCPRDPEVPAGARIRCFVDVNGGRVPYVLAIKKVADRTADYKLLQEKPFLVVEGLEGELSRAPGTSADCGEAPIRLYEVGTTIPCTVQARGRPRRPIKVKITKPDGSYVVQISRNRTPRRVLSGASLAFEIPPGFREVSVEKPEGVVGRAILRLARGNEITISQYRLERSVAPVTSDRRRRSAGAAVSDDLDAIGMRAEGPKDRVTVRGIEIDGVDGVLLMAKPRDPAAGFEQMRVSYFAVFRGRDRYDIACQYTPPRYDELESGCEHVLDTIDLRPYRG